MTIESVLVRVTNGHEQEYVEVPNVDVESTTDRERARKIAYRYIFKAREADYNELAHATRIVEVRRISSDVAETMISHIN